MNKKDVKNETMCDVCNIQNAGLVTACWDLLHCVESRKSAHMCTMLLEGIKNNLEVYDCETTKRLIKRVDFVLGKIGGAVRGVAESEAMLIKMLLNELNEVIGFTSVPIH